mmetsp:Transcript_9779/g.27720  ORF Transcript_9779/g.27720 Transcript_9779/m.27720 type:complete len:230 (-) Transcript_9779:251-940(-)
MFLLLLRLLLGSSRLLLLLCMCFLISLAPVQQRHLDSIFLGAFAEPSTGRRRATRPRRYFAIKVIILRENIGVAVFFHANSMLRNIGCILLRLIEIGHLRKFHPSSIERIRHVQLLFLLLRRDPRRHIPTVFDSWLWHRHAEIILKRILHRGWNLLLLLQLLTVAVGWTSRKFHLRIGSLVCVEGSAEVGKSCLHTIAVVHRGVLDVDLLTTLRHCVVPRMLPAVGNPW